MLNFLNSLFKKIVGSCKENVNPKNTLENTENTPQKEAFYHLFQKELYIVVLKQINFFPTKITDNSLHICAKLCLNLALINKNFYNHLKNTLFDLSRMHFLYSKYSKFKPEYETPIKHFLGSSFVVEYNFTDPPILIDALNSGCTLPYAKHSVNEVNFDEVKEIVRLFPSAIHSDLGELRCRTHVTPFVAGVFNPNVNEHVLRFLIENGCDSNTNYLLNNRKICLIDDIKDCDHDRYNLLIKIINTQ